MLSLKTLPFDFGGGGGVIFHPFHRKTGRQSCLLVFLFIVIIFYDVFNPVLPENA